MPSSELIDNDGVKKVGHREELTEDEISEILKCRDDPMHFINNYCYTQHPEKGRVPLELWDYQKELLHIYHNYKDSVNLLSRQMGKTTCAAAYLLWFAMFKSDKTILIAAQTLEGAQEIMFRVRYIYEECPMFIKAAASEYNKLSITFENKSRIKCTTTTLRSGRGMSISIAYLDEFAFVAPNIAKPFWSSLRPTLAAGGKCIITSTPNQDDDQFAQIWNQANNLVDPDGMLREEGSVGSNGFKAIKVIWDRHPDRDEEWAERERSAIGEEDFRREHMCEFVIADETLIDPLFLVNMDKGRDPIETDANGVRWYEEIQDDTLYIVALDPSVGTGGDPAAIQVFSLPYGQHRGGPPMRQVAEWRHRKTPMETQVRIMRDIIQRIDDKGLDCEINYSVENNGIGMACLASIKQMGEDNIPGTLISEPRRRGSGRRRVKGFGTTKASKIEACAKMKKFVEKNIVKINSRLLVRELKNFVAGGGSYKAKQGETDDLVMAFMLAVRMTMVASKHDEDAFDLFRDMFEDDEYREPMHMTFL